MLKLALTFLAALKFFRNLVGLQDEFYYQQMIKVELFEPILDLVIETMPRDTLLNSACLEFFDFIKRESIKSVIVHLVENYREKLKQITYVDIFSNFIMKYDQTQGFTAALETPFLDIDDETPRRPETGRGTRWENGIRDLDAQEEEYFNTSDDDEDLTPKTSLDQVSGVPALSKPLVDYPSDEEAENMDTDTVGPKPKKSDENKPSSVVPKDIEDNVVITRISSSAQSPPEKVSEKRRREEEDEDEMSKLSQPKRRNSSNSAGSNGSALRRKKSFSSSPRGGTSGNKPSKIAISLSPAIKTGGESPRSDGGS